MPPAELNRVLYRAFLRWAKAAHGVPFHLSAPDISQVLPTLSRKGELGLNDSEAVVRLTRSGFRAHQDLQDEDQASEALEAGLRGLRLLNSHYWHKIQSLRDQRSLHLDKTDVQHSIGQVLLHKLYGYRGVVIGWDSRCMREAGWAAALDLEHDQPFYKVLPDEDDCQKVFGSIRLTKYVAQQNVVLVPESRRVIHRALEEYFDAYSPAQKRYIPKRQLQFEYPDCYDFPDAVSCREDTNILRLGEEEGEPSPFKPQVRRWLEAPRSGGAEPPRPE